MKSILLIAVGLIVLAVAIVFVRLNYSDDVQNKEVAVGEPSVLDTTFVVDEKEFALVNGVAEIESAPDSASKDVLRIFGEPVYGDLDNDGDEDAAVLLQLTSGGSGVFYYAALALLDGTKYTPTNTMFLGDRIAPQTVEIQEGRAVFNYAERKADEPMSTQPSVGKSVWVHYDAMNNEIGEWVKDFEGEANFTERYSARVDRVNVVFEQKDYTSYRLTTNGLVREGELNTERGYGNDPDATVYVLNWQKPEGERMYYVRLTSEPTKLYVLDSNREIIIGSALTLE